MSLYPQQVLKRDGRLQAFDAGKIVQALAAAGRASAEFGEDEARWLTENGVLPELVARTLPGIEQIQDAVEATLFGAGWRRTLRAYTVYREQHRRLRDARQTLVDV